MVLSHLEQLESRWEEAFASPQWYLTVIPEIQRLTDEIKDGPAIAQDRIKTKLYDFFEEQLSKSKIALGRGLCGADSERKRIDTVVIHHTGNPPGLTPERLSAIELVRLYGPYFMNPKTESDKHLKGQPIASGHVRDGKQVFWPYHWIVRGDGRAECLLLDSEIGWHAGNWEENCRSVAIALDNDYEEKRPSLAELQGIAAIINSHYGTVAVARIVGHREVNSKTVCPSNLFLDGPHGHGWKKDLLELIQAETSLRIAA